ncbi:MAG: porin, partial [Gemmatimonadaceae bacterium]
MKRIAIVTCALALAAGSAHAQGLTMQMSNGWSFSFSGNVNAFLIYTDPKCSTPAEAGAGTAGCGFAGSLVPVSETAKTSAIRTGLLPAFATFEAKGKEGGLDLGVHFGFAPQIQNAGGVHDNFGNGTQAGAQIDMRQVYLTAGGPWGQILAGREIGLYQRNNILNDMTLFGAGPSGGGGAGAGGGTTLGRIGFGYVYPNFVAQMTYSSPASNPAQLSIGLFDPSAIDGYDVTKIPRVESEFTWTGHFGATTAEAPKGTDKVMIFVSGEWQHVQTPVATDATSKDSYGGAGGVRADFSGLSLVGSGFYG